ncbi:hypothetical protein [Actinomadura macra]|uniref:hypothetical protein n=1 Tax=Actinomadura macra TaxID=46164 RepID=UPI000829E320|nr:hypothetical protein [Actinomadura macra]
MTIGAYDARIKLLAVLDQGTPFTADTLKAGDAFDVIADIEVGKALNAVIDRVQIFASVGNLTQFAPVQAQTYDDPNPTAADAPYRDRITIPFVALAGVNEGDILQASATLKVTAGIWIDYSAETSETVVVAA